MNGNIVCLSRKPVFGFITVIIAVIIAVISTIGVALGEPLKFRMQNMANEHGFALQGANHIGKEDDRSLLREGELDHQIARLLANYNYVITRFPSGEISKLSVIGIRGSRSRQNSTPLRSDSIATLKIRNEHYLEAVLTGPNGKSVSERLLVDTGASTLVLPKSAAAEFGFRPRDLRPVRVQTANGITNGAMAVLPKVKVGARTAERVEATFVEDSALGGKKLLGMSFLGRYKLTIDGSAGKIELHGRED